MMILTNISKIKNSEIDSDSISEKRDESVVINRVDDVNFLSGLDAVMPIRNIKTIKHLDNSKKKAANSKPAKKVAIKPVNKAKRSSFYKQALSEEGSDKISLEQLPKEFGNSIIFNKYKKEMHKKWSLFF